MKKIFRFSLLLGVAVLLLAPAGAVSARDAEQYGGQKTATADDTTLKRGEHLRQYLQEQKARREAMAKTRLETTKVRVCELRQAKIKAIMERSVQRAENQLKLFDTIAARTKAFYEEKGKTLATYNELVAATENAKTKAVGEIETMKQIEPFDCAGNDPKGVADDFKASLQAVNQALHQYRTSVKNLIVGVKSAQSERNT